MRNKTFHIVKSRHALGLCRNPGIPPTRLWHPLNVPLPRAPKRGLQHGIGIGAGLSGRTPPTPPGMRVRTGRFEKLRSGEFGYAQAGAPCSLWPVPAKADPRPLGSFVHAAPIRLHRSQLRTRLHRALPPCAPSDLAALQTSDAIPHQASCLVTVLLVRPFVVPSG